MNLFHSLHYQTHRMRVWIHLLGQCYVSFWGPLVLKSVQLYQTLLSEDDHSFPRGGGVCSCGREVCVCVCAGVGWIGVSPHYTISVIPTFPLTPSLVPRLFLSGEKEISLGGGHLN